MIIILPAFISSWHHWAQCALWLKHRLCGFPASEHVCFFFVPSLHCSLQLISCVPNHNRSGPAHTHNRSKVALLAASQVCAPKNLQKMPAKYTIKCVRRCNIHYSEDILSRAILLGFLCNSKMRPSTWIYSQIHRQSTLAYPFSLIHNTHSHTYTHVRIFNMLK